MLKNELFSQIINFHIMNKFQQTLFLNLCSSKSLIAVFILSTIFTQLINSQCVQQCGNTTAYFGWQVGVNNTTGNFNSFFGPYCGYNNTEGTFNSFFGTYCG